VTPAPKREQRDSAEQTDAGSPGGSQLDDPNRNAVGLEPAWAEGFGGSDTSGGSGPTAAKRDEPEPEPKARRETKDD
jgi:hypothetical protein